MPQGGGGLQTAVSAPEPAVASSEDAHGEARVERVGEEDSSMLPHGRRAVECDRSRRRIRKRHDTPERAEILHKMQLAFCPDIN